MKNTLLTSNMFFYGGIYVTKYEYKCVMILGMGERTTRILNEYGQMGWELVYVVLFWHYFKRPLDE